MKITKYTPNLVHIRGKVLDLNCLKRLSIEYDKDKSPLQPYYVWIINTVNSYNEQFYFDTLIEAKNFRNKLMKLAKIKEVVYNNIPIWAKGIV